MSPAKRIPPCYRLVLLVVDLTEKAVGAFSDSCGENSPVESTTEEFINDFHRKALEPKQREGELYYLTCLKDDRIRELERGSGK